MKVTVIITAYNHERFIQTALSSALTQRRPADEIIVIDDASPDRTAAVIATTLQDCPGAPVSFMRNEANLGVTGSVAKAVAAASGDLIVFMSGDDVSEPGRLGHCLAFFESHPTVMAIITDAHVIDESARRIGRLDNCAGLTVPAVLGMADLPPGVHFLRGRSACGAAAAYRADVFRRFPPLRAGLYSEDDPAAFRAMLLGGCAFLPMPLLSWRKHASNLSHGSGARRDAQMVGHFRRCVAMNEQMLDDAEGWKSLNPAAAGPGLDHAMAGLRFQRAKWMLWAAAHGPGISLAAFVAAAKFLAEHRPSIGAFLGEFWRPACRMFIPFSLQRLLAKLRRL